MNLATLALGVLLICGGVAFLASARDRTEAWAASIALGCGTVLFVIGLG